MATECWLCLLMVPDGNSTLWEGSWVSPNVVVGDLAPKTTEGETEDGKYRVHMYVVINHHLHSLCLLSSPSVFCFLLHIPEHLTSSHICKHVW